MKIYTYIVLFILVGSCIREWHGWQDKVVFTKEGGEVTITGNKGTGSTAWDFTLDDEYLPPDERIERDDEIIMRKDWLTIKYRNGYSTYLTLIAKPMDGNEIRNLGVETGGVNTWERIGIYQYPKDSVQLGLKPKP